MDIKKIISKIDGAVEEYSMLAGCRGVLVGLSGGKDSVCLLHYLASQFSSGSCEINVYACHLNHMIRGAEADADENFCRDLCRSLGVDFISEKRDIPVIAEKTKKSIEEAARDARYDLFDRAAGISGCDRIATAHTASDNAETIIFRIARGTSVSGLCGIPPVRDNIIRPLIDLNSDEVIAYCNYFGLEFRTDSTNADISYPRNLIRAEIIPQLERINPSFANAARRLSRSASEQRKYIISQADKYNNECSKNRIPIELAQRLNAGTEKCILYELIVRAIAGETSVPVTTERFDALSALIAEPKPDKVIEITNGLSAYPDADMRYLEFGTPPDNINYTVMLCEGVNRIKETGVVIEIERCGGYSDFKNINKMHKIIYVNSDMIKSGLTARSRAEGDCYIAGGMTRKVKKIISGSDFTRSERQKTPVICDEQGIIWIPGGPLCDRLRPQKNCGLTKIIFNYQ
ncbi:tRNA(Ile)-lysidine synthase [bioreactor metagenome]|uniref:tRNA(Ile)-lysidine synthetase n=1 Tax=bioreactor metagenome TaxID=1076179 RepID=A0A644YTV6_9ZZZZ|nr:tRNA lysidine(34) synthetase TilS [Oscillospiraceae bacterium]